MATRLGLHVTAEELAIWQSRAASGPYKTSGDVSTNSPGDWTRIAANALTFKNATFTAYAGQTTNTCVLAGGNPSGILNDFTVQQNMKDAGFYYLITGDTAYSDKVRSSLLTQAATAGTDFSNRLRWCQDVPYGPLIDENPTMELCAWLTRLLFAYDYTKATFSGAEQTTMNTWFLNAATFFVQNYDHWVTPARYPSRPTSYGDATLSGAGVNLRAVYNGGPSIDDWIGDSANRASTINRFGALVGIMLNDTYLKAQAKAHFKEVLMFAVWSDGTSSDYSRWTTGAPDLGWQYCALNVGSLASIADAFARTGDYELWNYSTSAGADGTTGGPKSLAQMVNLHLSHVNHTTLRYIPGHAGDSNYAIDTVDPIGGGDTADEHNFTQANIWINSATNKTLYMRTAAGAPAYPTVANYATGGWYPWTGEWGIYPGPMFMWGQLEGVINPFSLTSTSPAPPNAPSGLTVHWV